MKERKHELLEEMERRERAPEYAGVIATGETRLPGHSGKKRMKAGKDQDMPRGLEELGIHLDQ